jgi:thiamine transport system substrate-binding protein
MFSYSKKIVTFGLALTLSGFWWTGCTPAAKPTLTVITHDSFAVSDSVLKDFESQNQATVTVLKSGDAGEALNKVILTGQAPVADVIFGVDNTLLTRALDSGVLDAYSVKELAVIPAAFQLDAAHRLTPVDFGDVCLNDDRQWFASRSLPVPSTWEELADPKYKDLLVVENPATSSTGLAFLLATVARFGPQGFITYWQQLRANGVLVEDSWNSAYYTDFSGSSGKGQRPLVVSYASSPPAEIIFAEKPPAEPPTASIAAPGMCFRQIEFAGILKGTKNRELAEKFIDFLVGTSFQADIPLQMFMFPVRPDVSLPDAFQKYAQVPDQPAVIAPDEIAAHREEWIRAWKAAVLR